MKRSDIEKQTAPFELTNISSSTQDTPKLKNSKKQKVLSCLKYFEGSLTDADYLKLSSIRKVQFDNDVERRKLQQLKKL